MGKGNGNCTRASLLETNFSYETDDIGKACLRLARESKAKTGFGAVIVKQGKIVASGRNRRSLPGENQLLKGGVDYATHAEQAAIIEALQNRIDLEGAELYVLGEVRRGEDKGKLSVRAKNSDHFFTCKRCANTLNKFKLPVNIPLPSGWHTLDPQVALETATSFKTAGKKRSFTAAI